MKEKTMSIIFKIMVLVFFVTITTTVLFSQNWNANVFYNRQFSVLNYGVDSSGNPVKLQLNSSGELPIVSYSQYIAEKGTCFEAHIKKYLISGATTEISLVTSGSYNRIVRWSCYVNSASKYIDVDHLLGATITSSGTLQTIYNGNHTSSLTSEAVIRLGGLSSGGSAKESFKVGNIKLSNYDDGEAEIFGENETHIWEIANNSSGNLTVVFSFAWCEIGR